MFAVKIIVVVTAANALGVLLYQIRGTSKAAPSKSEVSK
jgi:hypothetical protein